MEEQIYGGTPMDQLKLHFTPYFMYVGGIFENGSLVAEEVSQYGNYPKDDAEAIEMANEIIDNFNSHLKEGETPRVVVRVVKVTEVNVN